MNQAMLIGRDKERAVLDRLLDAARSGQSSSVVLRGEPGVGKTALLDYAIDSAPDMRVLRAFGVEFEMELTFAGLHQLCTPLLDRLDRLPGHQQQALRVAFGMSAGEPPDRFIVGLAALSLLSDAAEEEPLLCAVDDAQWLDRSSALVLAFITRRLLAESVAVVLVTREPTSGLRGLPELPVEGISADDARLLLASGVHGILDEAVEDRIVSETRGNPLALLELPRGLTPAELAGGFGLPDTAQLSDRIEESFARRLGPLPSKTRRLLLAAAAEPVGDVSLLWRAAEKLGLGVDSAEPAESAGLIELGGRVRFRHPLVRSAVYRTAAVQDRREAHRVLAETTDPAADPDRRAWHRAHAAAGLDEEVACDLERSANRAQGRGGVAAAAAFLEKAAELTPDPARRGERALAAAQAKLEAGAPGAARALAAAAQLTPLDGLQQARLHRVRAEIAFARRRGSDAPPLLLDAARRLVPLDPRLARETCLEALGATIFAGRLGNVGDAVEIASCRPPASPSPRSNDLLLEGLCRRVTEGYAAGIPALREGVERFRRDDEVDAESDRWLWLACRVAADLWEDEIWDELATRGVQRAREAGALSVLPLALTYRAGVDVHAGEFSSASALIEEADAITLAIGSTPPLAYTSLVLAAYRGNEVEAQALIEAGRQDASERGEGRAIALAEYATAVLYNSLGAYDVALAAAQRGCDHDDLGLLGWALIELVEAGARGGDHEIATSALRRLEERARGAGTEWALGTLARSNALLSDGDAADALYREGIERLGRSRITVHLARAHLVYGEWLRRENRRLEARKHLRLAHEAFSKMGAEAFSERARSELLATGETASKRSVAARDDLTPQEALIARLARDGFSNPEIGARLFISPRTVQYHLGKVFMKLDIKSRTQLGGVPADRLNPA